MQEAPNALDALAPEPRLHWLWHDAAPAYWASALRIPCFLWAPAGFFDVPMRPSCPDMSCMSIPAAPGPRSLVEVFYYNRALAEVINGRIVSALLDFVSEVPASLLPPPLLSPSQPDHLTVVASALTTPHSPGNQGCRPHYLITLPLYLILMNTTHPLHSARSTLPHLVSKGNDTLHPHPPAFM